MPIQSNFDIYSISLFQEFGSFYNIKHNKDKEQKDKEEIKHTQKQN